MTFEEEAQAQVQKVIRESPGLEDDESPVLSAKDVARATAAFDDDDDDDSEEESPPQWVVISAWAFLSPRAKAASTILVFQAGMWDRCFWKLS